MEFSQIFSLILGISVLFLIGMIVRTKIRFKEINQEYGKPYKAAIVRIVKTSGNEVKLRSGTTSLAFHPKGAISFDTMVIRYSQVESILASKRLEHFPAERKRSDFNHIVLKDLFQQPDDESGKYIWISFKSVEGKNEIVFTVKGEAENVENELFRCWRKYQIMGN